MTSLLGAAEWKSPIINNCKTETNPWSDSILWILELNQLKVPLVMDWTNQGSWNLCHCLFSMRTEPHTGSLTMISTEEYFIMCTSILRTGCSPWSPRLEGITFSDSDLFLETGLYPQLVIHCQPDTFFPKKRGGCKWLWDGNTLQSGACLGALHSSFNQCFYFHTWKWLHMVSDLVYRNAYSTLNTDRSIVDTYQELS
jgi:hypothetical protein